MCSSSTPPSFLGGELGVKAFRNPLDPFPAQPRRGSRNRVLELLRGGRPQERSASEPFSTYKRGIFPIKTGKTPWVASL